MMRSRYMADLVSTLGTLATKPQCFMPTLLVPLETSASIPPSQCSSHLLTITQSLFLEREVVENMDPRIDSTSAVRSHLLNTLSLRMQIPSRDDIVVPPIRDGAPIDGTTSGRSSGQNSQQGGVGAGPRPASPVFNRS